MGTGSAACEWVACRAAFVRHETFILERLEFAPQTNEIRRSSALIPGFLTIASLHDKPFVLSEVGASAGLNMLWDRFYVNLGGLVTGPVESTVHLSPDWTGPPPPKSEIHVQDRAGCDLNPLDPSNSEHHLRLLSYLWADQSERISRTRVVLDMSVKTGIRVEKADAIDWLENRLSLAYENAVHVIYHSIAWQYFPASLKEKGEALIARAGSKATVGAPVARLQMEADDNSDGAAISLEIWPSGERHIIGRADFHGRWIKWYGWPGLK